MNSEMRIASDNLKKKQQKVKDMEKFIGEDVSINGHVYQIDGYDIFTDSFNVFGEKIPAIFIF